MAVKGLIKINLKKHVQIIGANPLFQTTDWQVNDDEWKMKTVYY